MQININMLAVFVAAVASMALGAIWFGPLFGKDWMKFTGLNKSARAKGKEKMGKNYAIGFIGALMTAYVMSLVVSYTEASTMYEGVVSGFWVWVGFVATTSLGRVLWEGKSWELYWLNNGYNFINLSVMGAILAVWV